MTTLLVALALIVQTQMRAVASAAAS